MESLVDQQHDAIAASLQYMLDALHDMNKGVQCVIASPMGFDDNPQLFMASIADKRPSVRLRWSLRLIGQHIATNAADKDAALARVENAVCGGHPLADWRRMTLRKWWYGLRKSGPYSKSYGMENIHD